MEAGILGEFVYDNGQVQVNYAEGGTPGKPVLVFLHGLTGQWQAYTGEFAEYARDWHIFAPDLRGHGKSSKPDEGYLLPDYAADVTAFLRDVVREPVVLVGHSLGGLVTLACTQSGPEHLRAVIANDPPLLGDDLGIDDYPGAKAWFSWVYETIKGNPDFENVLDACKLMNPGGSEAELQAQAEQVFGVAAGTVKVALEDQQKTGFDTRAMLQSIRCPALLLYGDFSQGSVVRDQDAEKFKQLVPHGVVKKVPGGSHGFWWEQPEVTRQHVREFLSTIG